MMLSKVDPWYSTLRPSFSVTALNRSMSKPTMSSLASRNSLGAYVGSVPTLMVPLLAISSGTSLARSSSCFTEALAEDPPAPSESLLSAHAESEATLSAPAARRPQRRRDLVDTEQLLR